MAKIKYSALVSEMSGKLNGSVMARNRSGNYVRTKTTPVNPQTDFQVAVRNRLAGFSAGWRGLTAQARAAWNSAVSDWTKTNIFGDIVRPSGQNLYIAVNSNIQNAGGVALTMPPNKVGADSLVEISVTADVVAGTMTLDFDPAAVPAGHVMMVEATAPLSAGISYMKNRFRQIAILPAATASGADIYTAYVEKFGEPTAGKKIGVRAKFITIATGEVSLPLSAETIL